jgi:DNA-3-methyladenine glycosylase I
LEKPKTYCEAVVLMDNDNVHKMYHDNEYGFPIEDDNELFARLVLEINQAGLSWTTILKKKDNFYKAYEGFDIEKVAAFDEEKFAELIKEPGIIRNRLKIAATIENAKRLLLIQEENGSFKTWLDEHHPKTREEWMKLFKKTFKFTGGEIVNEFLLSTGYLPGAHVSTCSIYKQVLATKPKWL